MQTIKIAKIDYRYIIVARKRKKASFIKYTLWKLMSHRPTVSIGLFVDYMRAQVRTVHWLLMRRRLVQLLNVFAATNHSFYRILCRIHCWRRGWRWGRRGRAWVRVRVRIRRRWTFHDRACKSLEIISKLLVFIFTYEFINLYYFDIFREFYVYVSKYRNLGSPTWT